MEIAAISGSLKVLARLMLPEMRLLRAARRAAQSPVSFSYENDSLDQQLEKALALLGSNDENPRFWRGLLTKIGAPGIRPDYFRLPKIQEWLSNDQVKCGFKRLVRDRLIGKEIDSYVLNRIREKYTEVTGVTPFGATYAIDVVLSVLYSSIRATLGSGESVIIDIIKDTHADSVEKISEQSHAIEGVKDELRRFLPLEDALHGEVLRKELARIVKRRAFRDVNSANEIEELLVKIQGEGSLSRAPISDKAEVYYWAARIFVPDKKRIDQAQNYLRLYKNTLHPDSNKVAFIEAWLCQAEGQTQKAIDILSNLDSPDARTSILTLLANRDGNTAALNWLADNAPYTHTLLNPIGWQNAVGMMVDEGRWQAAINLLENLPEDVFVSFPDLFFVKGLLHAGFLLPEPVRPSYFRQSYVDFKGEVQEGGVAAKHRPQAIQAFLRARELLLELGAEERVRGCDYNLMWIRLTDPQVRDEALFELTEKMKDEKHALFLLDIALNFEVTFDPDPLRRYLRRREIEGRQDSQDSVAKFLLLRRFGTPSEVLSYLEDEKNTLKEMLSSTTLASAKIRALVENKQIADAEKELNACANVFSQDDLARHQLMIADLKGEDLKQIETLYQRTGQYEDLANLVRYFERTRQWASLLPYAKKLLATRRSATNLLSLIRAMRETGSADADIVACLDEYGDLVVPRTPEGDELLLSRGLALFGIGRFAKAQEIASEVALNLHHPNAILLEISVALRTGQWEHFTAIIDREFPRLEELPPRVLLQMASVIADWDPDRAMKITVVAAEKEPENGEIQAAAYGLASQIGKEVDATIWFDRMTRLAQQGEGPFQLFTIREVAEKIPLHAEQRREWEQQYCTGEIGLHQISGMLNIPMTQILVGALLRNEKESDPRRRTIIPIRHGGRGLVELSAVHSIAFDLASLLVLESLEILQATFNSLEKVYLSPRFMDVLFNEQRQVRFHQPSRVEEAKRILKLIDDGVIQLLREVQPPDDLVKEVGLEMASLLHMAQVNGGRVVSTLPIHKAGSLGEEIADLREYGSLLLKTTQLLPHIEAHISPAAYTRARSFLASVDRGEPLGENGLGDGSLYVDDLALRYLDTSGILQHLHRLGRNFFVADSVKGDSKALIDAAEHGDEIAGVIDRLRKRVRDGVQSGKVLFLPASSHGESRRVVRHLDALLDLITPSGIADVICLDDRTFGKYAALQHDRSVPIVSSLDVLEHLSAQGSIKEEWKRTCDFRLRKGGVAFLPLNVGGLLAALKDSIDPSQTQFTENRDLAALRENLQRIRSMKLLRVPEEGEWLSQMIYAARQILDKIWGDSTIAIEMAEKISNWVFDVLAPLPVDWRESIVQVNEENIVDLTKSVLLLFLNRRTTFTDATRMEAYATWAERHLIRPLLQANVSLVDEVSTATQPVVSQFAKEVSNIRPDAAVLFYLRSLPSSIRVHLFDNPEFQKDIGINGLAVPVADAGPIWLGNLLDAVRTVYDTKREQIIRSLTGKDVQLGLDDGRATISRIGDNARATTPTRFEFALLSPDMQTRLEQFSSIFHSFGVTGPAPSYWVPILESRPLLNGEVAQIHGAIRRSVPKWEALTQDKISTHTLTQADLVPPLADYFTALCGPLPNGMSANEYICGPLATHRQELIAKNLSEGISLLLPGCLRVDASVAALLSRFTDDEIWHAVERLQDVPDPFTLLGLLEITLARRATKPEFEVLANDLVEKLCSEKLSRRDGSDVYDLLPPLVKLSLHHLRRIDGMMMQPPYWHRLCAFTHAGLLIRLLNGLEFDLREMTQWLESTGLVSDGLADILALRSEPTWHFGHLTRDHIQAEILGRLKQLEENEEVKGKLLPNSDILNERIDMFLEQGILPFQPGPLEGALRPIDRKSERTLPDKDVIALTAQLNDTPGEFPWVGVEELSTIYFLPDRLRNSLAESLKTIELPGETFLDRTNLLGFAGLIAAFHKDREIAETIAERLFREFEGENDTQPAFLTLLTASTAIDENEWIDWLKEKLYRLALLAPPTGQLETLGMHIDELKPLLSISQWRFGQVEAMCKMGPQYPKNQVTL